MNNKSYERILIVKTSSLGDIIHAYPAIEYIRAVCPNAKIDWVVESSNADLVENHPYVNRAIKVSTKAWRKSLLSKKTFNEIKAAFQDLKLDEYDAAIDLQGNIKSGLIMSQVKAKDKVGFASESVPEWPNMLFTNQRYNPTPGQNIRQDYLAVVQGYFGEEASCADGAIVLKVDEAGKKVVQAVMEKVSHNQGIKVMVCPGSAWPNKQLTKETLQAFLARVYGELNASFLFVWGSAEEKEHVTALQQQFSERSIVVDRLKLPLLQNLMGECDLVIAMDSLPLHLAGTTRAKTYSVFGASSAAKYNPLGITHGALQGVCPYGRTFTKRCPILRTCKTGACIHDLNPNDLFAHFSAWWDHNGRK